MRFLENGPWIPDDLLIARDEGRVVFFCGAGVSRARAGLPDFFDLADNVIQRLGAPADSHACKLLNEAREIDKRIGVSGLISADRIFGLLERDFLVQDIEAAIAKALHPSPDVDLSAHRLLINLATTPEGKVRLVTTNFDRLFDDCDNALKVWQPPRLPDPSRQDEMDGIIHLHGRANEDYSGSEGDGFILSSSDFGRSYLSDGWATDFFREIIDRYVVVFIGYTADDPPVHYLLEALNKKSGQLRGVYAFQVGEANDATARWRHKGIEAIAYAEANGHRALWDTLEAWAARAKAPEDWFSAVIDLAKKGPENLLPHQRGQVAHVISTLEGVRKFSEKYPPPPAEWLCVFDPYRRYAKPGHIDGIDTGQFVDPFDLYGLDSDVIPKRIGPGDLNVQREVPRGVWDGFAMNGLERENLSDGSFSALRGSMATNIPRLPIRLAQLGIWIAKIADEPASVWWAAHQIALHPDIQRQIRREIESSSKVGSSVMRQAWRYLFDAWGEKRGDFDHDGYDLKTMIEKDGWDSAAVRKYAIINRPHIKIKLNYGDGPKPPVSNENIRVADMFRLDVKYHDQQNDIEIPDEWLGFAVRELRKNLEHTLQLELEIRGYGLRNISPIIPDDGSSDDSYNRTHGLSGRVISFSSLFARLIELDVSTARQELAAWPINDETIFSRLRIWSSGKAELISPQTLGPHIASLHDGAFWDAYHQRDLLVVLAKRWKELQTDTQSEIEGRLLKGPPKWENEEDDKFTERQAWESINRITWLANAGCQFAFDLETETNKLRSLAPKWKPEYAAKAAKSMEGGRYWVKTETEYSLLLDEPLTSTLSKALELSGRTEDYRTERDPFSGLSADHPVRSFAALTIAARLDKYPAWAWRTFLNSEARRNDKPKLTALIAERISRFPDEAVMEFVHPTSDWLLKISKNLASHFPSTFNKVISKLINVLRLQPTESQSAIIQGNKEPDWVTDAINAPVGKIAEALFFDPRSIGLKGDEEFPEEWLGFVNKLLSLPGDLRRHALVIFAHNLNWFYAIDSGWTESNLLSVLHGNGPHDRNAVWSGFFWAAQVPDQTLFMRIKPALLALAKEMSLPRTGHGEVLAGIILAGWGNLSDGKGARWISNSEMRDVLLHADDEFRSQVLWQAENWSDDSAENTSNKWSEMSIELISDVWPRQLSVKTSTISTRLCDLAFSYTKRFPEMADAVLPLLTTIDRDHMLIPSLWRNSDNIASQYPRHTLALLHAVLPDNVASWPYGIESTLLRIGEADSGLNLDERLLELRRKWKAR